jgi:signal transduction histidine kinase
MTRMAFHGGAFGLEDEHALREQLEAVDAAALKVTRALASPRESTEAVLASIASEAAALTDADAGALVVGERRLVSPPSPRLEAVLAGSAPDAGVLAVTVFFGERRLGTLLVAGKHDAGGFTARDRSSLEMFGERVGHAIELARLHDEQRRDRVRLQLLSDTGRALASSLDSRETLCRIARLAVPRLGDWVAFHRFDGTSLSLACVAHADEAAEQQLSERLSAAPCALDADLLVARAARERTPLLVTCVERPRDVFGVDDLADGLEGLEVRSCLAVPMTVGSRLLGTLVVCAARPELTYDAHDLSLADELASRTALALDNARLYQDAQQAIRSRDNVMAIVSHDLRSPLNAISLNLSLLTRPRPDGCEDRRRGKSQLESINRSVQRVGRMVEDLLAASTIQSGHFTVRACAEPTKALFEDLVQALEPMAEHQGVLLEACLPNDLPAVRCDRDRVQQVFANLCGNALHVLGTSGTIRVSAAVEGPDAVRFSVKDTGPGIPAGQLAAVFDRYWQGEPGSSSGVGLGLYIVKGIVEAHGGRVWAESAPGEGATFLFTLPIAR